MLEARRQVRDLRRTPMRTGEAPEAGYAVLRVSVGSEVGEMLPAVQRFLGLLNLGDSR